MSDKAKALYDNCRCISITGEHMFYCSKRKAESYLKKKQEDGSPLAKMISEDPFVFQLMFETVGEGNPDAGPKANFCERCNTTENLTKHHVVPYAYRSLLPDEWKDHRSEEVVPLCRTCHDMYEMEADILKQELELSVEDAMEQRMKMIRGRKARRTLHNHGYFLPVEKLDQLKEDAKYWSEGDEIPSPESLVLASVDIPEFVNNWKAHYAEWLDAQRKALEHGK